MKKWVLWLIVFLALVSIVTLGVLFIPFYSSTLPMPAGHSLSQLDKDSSFPIKFMDRGAIGDYQKAAQTFKSPYDFNASFLTLLTDYSIGDAVFLGVYELGETDLYGPTNGSLIYSKEISFQGRPTNLKALDISLEEVISFEEGSYYSIVIFTNNKGSELSWGLSNSDVFDNGAAWFYTVKTSGNGEIIDYKHSWINSGGDFAFEISGP